MGFISAEERALAAALSRLGYANPFLPERIEAEGAALGPAFVHADRVWSVRTDRTVQNPNVARLAERATTLAALHPLRRTRAALRRALRRPLPPAQPLRSLAHPHRVGAVRPPPRCILRRPPGPRRLARDLRAVRDGFPGRDRRRRPGDPGEAPARPPGAHLPAPRRHETAPLPREDHGRHQPRPGARDPGGPLPRGLLLSPLLGHHRHAVTRRATSRVARRAPEPDPLPRAPP